MANENLWSSSLKLIRISLCCYFDEGFLVNYCGRVSRKLFIENKRVMLFFNITLTVPVVIPTVKSYINYIKVLVRLYLYKAPQVW